MRHLRGSLTLERALQLLIVTTIVSAMLAAGAILDWLEPARKLRWVALLALAAAAVAYALGRREGRKPIVPLLAAAALLALAGLSTAWSSHPALTLGRAAALGLVFISAAGLAVGAAGRPDSIRRLLHAVLVAAGVVALGGLLVLALDPDRAVQGATAQEPARYQGLGGGPNTAMMLLAVALPLAAHTLVEARTRVGRGLALVLAALLVGSIVASGSRGALLAGFGGLLAYAVLAPRRGVHRVLAGAAVAALLGVGVAASRLPQPDPTVVARPGTALAPVAVPAPGYLDANAVLRLQEDLGRLPDGTIPENTSRSLVGGSGRRQAWEGALRLAAERPAVGYGFGTEDRVFVDRYLAHGSNLPENSYVGLFLQLGAAGVVLFALLLVALAASGVRALRRPPAPVARIAAASAGAVAAGLLLALTQSFVYAPGSNATAAFWICAFLLPAAGVTAHADAH